MIFPVLFRNYNDMNYLRFKQILQSRTSHVQDNENRLINRERERERERERSDIVRSNYLMNEFNQFLHSLKN